MSKHDNALARWMRCASVAQRKRAAVLAGSSENYFYQVASLRREPSVSLGGRICAAIKSLHDESDGLLPLVTLDDLSSMFAEGGL